MRRRSWLSVMQSPLTAALLLAASAATCCAQELLKNGNFEAPFPGTDPTTNWVVVFQEGGPGDFDIAGPSTEASNGGGGTGAHLRNLAPRWSTKAYFKQIVPSLTSGASYTFTIQKMKRGDYNNLNIWAAVVSGATSNTVYGNETNVGPYSLVITAAPSRSIEVQLHLTKGSLNTDDAENYRSIACWGHFDDCSLTLTP
jgi:hypothetical protein